MPDYQCLNLTVNNSNYLDTSFKQDYYCFYFMVLNYRNLISSHLNILSFADTIKMLYEIDARLEKTFETKSCLASGEIGELPVR